MRVLVAGANRAIGVPHGAALITLTGKSNASRQLQIAPNVDCTLGPGSRCNSCSESAASTSRIRVCFFAVTMTNRPDLLTFLTSDE
jgi:pectin methylesterase-like acyl-CoA thioesterase